MPLAAPTSSFGRKAIVWASMAMSCVAEASVKRSRTSQKAAERLAASKSGWIASRMPMTTRQEAIQWRRSPYRSTSEAQRMRRAKPGARVAGAAFSAVKKDSFAEEQGGCHQESGDLRSGDRAIDRRVECAVPISPDHPITRSPDAQEARHESKKLPGG